ncbi:MAG: 4-alpha-glucanotransferase, partial [Sphingobium sp.]
AEPGYHRLDTAGGVVTLAIAPPRCIAPPPGHSWGPAVQIPALRGTRPAPYGDLGTLAEAARAFADAGADTLAISPTHALFPADATRFSPYAPSSRLFLNVALADPAMEALPGFPRDVGGALIDWEAAVPQHLAVLRTAFAALGAETRMQLSQWTEEQGETLRRHATFDALHLHFRGQAAGWREWPADYHDPDGDAVRRFAEGNRGEISFHMFAQWLSRQNLSAAQRAAKDGGMALGLIADVAVGVDPGGSDAWSLRNTMLSGLSIGAPPDPLGPDGQNWGITGFSPQGLTSSGFAPWIAMLRAALADAGGVRIDHGFGLSRLWVVPEGGRPSDGAYLTYPFDDMLRVLALESHRANAIVVAEDLGTMPWGFGQAIADRDILGMRVMWFERNGEGGYTRPEDYGPASVAMTGTHDTPTVAGWWKGRDMDWNRKLARGGPTDENARADERRLFWATVGDGEPQPAVDDAAPVVDAAVRTVARAASHLAIVPLEDLLALEEQPNLPGIIDEHPNWRRRLPGKLGDLLTEPEVEGRIATLNRERP